MEDGYYENAYYKPEKWGLEIVSVEDEPNLSWEFNTFVIWKDLNNPYIYYWDFDSGCSCPSPFEDLRGRENLAEGSYADAQRHLEAWRKGWRGD